NEMNNEKIKIWCQMMVLLLRMVLSTYTLQNIIPFDRHSVEDNRVYKIKTKNTVDLRFDGRYFLR
ncbi:hypothetical protein H8356DRAFT_1737257, partial [Neocallimastix lanati (nom. inval.)]